MANFDMTRPATNKAIYAVAATLAYKFIGQNDLKRFEFNKIKARFGEPLAGDINNLFNVKKITEKNSDAAKYLKVLKTEDLKPNQEAPITAKGKVSKNFKTSSAPRIATAADLGMI